MYTPVLLAPSHLGVRPSVAYWRVFEVVPDDVLAVLRSALPALATFSKQLLTVVEFQAYGNADPEYCRC